MTEDNHSGADRRAMWERKWAQPDFVPAFRIKTVPSEIREAVEEAWFPPGASLLDIGCGDGELAAWLAGAGYDVLGVDFADSAIARAERTYRGVAGVAFEVVDICAGPPRRDGFGALVDRGCLQGVPADAAPDYVRNVASVASTDARFLLFHRLHQGSSTEETAGKLETLFRDAFDVVRVADTEIASDPTRFPEPMRGVACWMIRRG